MLLIMSDEKKVREKVMLKVYFNYLQKLMLQNSFLKS